MTLRLLFLVTVLFILQGCIDRYDYQQQAKKTCTCMKPIFSFDKLTQMAIMAEDTAALNKLAANLENIEQESNRCMEELGRLIDGFSETQKVKLWTACTEECPGIVSQIRARLDTTFYKRK